MYCSENAHWGSNSKYNGPSSSGISKMKFTGFVSLYGWFVSNIISLYSEFFSIFDSFFIFIFFVIVIYIKFICFIKSVNDSKRHALNK